MYVVGSGQASFVTCWC